MVPPNHVLQMEDSDFLNQYSAAQRGWKYQVPIKGEVKANWHLNFPILGHKHT